MKKTGNFHGARKSVLGGLAEENQFATSLDCRGMTPDVLFGYLHDMLLIRVVEEEVRTLVEEGRARTPCHLGIGQEAIAVGVSVSLRPTDRVFGGHRSHSQYLAMGGDVYALIAEILGKEDGASRGMGGSMHLYAPDVGFKGSVPLVGATIPIAVGAALAAKFDRSDSVAVTYFGDGAAEEGVIHESLNFAANYELPILFVCENNLYSSHLDILLRQPSDRIARFGEAHCMETATVDGNDVLTVAETARRLIARAREGCGPAFLEAVTYRHCGHVGSKEDVDVGVRRTLSELKAWKKRDPIRRLFSGMAEIGLIDEIGFLSRVTERREEVRAYVQRAIDADYPAPSALTDRVYARPNNE